MWVIRLLALSSLLLAIGCSTVKFAYDRADWLLLAYTEDFVDLDDKQRERLRAALQSRLAEHRRLELPQYVSFLETAAGFVENGFTTAEADSLFATVRELYAQAATRTVPAITPTLAALRPEQVDELNENLEKANRQYRKKYLQADARTRHAGRVKRMTERIEGWTGRLSNEQRGLIERWVETMPSMRGPWYTYRVRKQEGFVALLRSAAKVARIERYLIAWWVTQPEMSAELRAGTDNALAAMRDLVVEIDQTLSDRQRARALDRLRGLHRDLGRALIENQIAWRLITEIGP